MPMDELTWYCSKFVRGGLVIEEKMCVCMYCQFGCRSSRRIWTHILQCPSGSEQIVWRLYDIVMNRPWPRMSVWRLVTLLASFMKSSDLHRVKRGQGWMPLPNQPVSVCILAVVYELSLGGLVHRFLTGRNTITAAALSFSLPSLHLSPHLQSQACIGNLTSLYLHLALAWLGWLNTYGAFRFVSISWVL